MGRRRVGCRSLSGLGWRVVACLAGMTVALAVQAAGAEAAGGEKGSAFDGERIKTLLAAVDRGDEEDIQPALRALAGVVGEKYLEDQRGEAVRLFASELAGRHTARTRQEICRLLGVFGGAESVNVLYPLLMDSQVRDAARDALVRIPSQEATRALVAGLQITEGTFRVTLVDGLGRRGDVAAVPTLGAVVFGPDAELSRAAMAALSRMADPGALRVLVRAVAEKMAGAASALVALGTTLADAEKDADARMAFRTVIKAFEEQESKRAGEPESRGTGEQEGRSAGERTGSAGETRADKFARHGESPVATHAPRGADEAPPASTWRWHPADESGQVGRGDYCAALQGLGRVANDEDGRMLEAVAKESPGEVRAAAVTGLLGLARRQEAEARSAAAALYSRLFGLAVGLEESKAVLEGLARTAGPDDVGMLDAVFPLLGEEVVWPEACRAAVRLAMQLPADRRAEAREVLEAAALLMEKDPMLEEVVEYLWKVGSDYDPGLLAGYITKWKVVGPMVLGGLRNEQGGKDATGAGGVEGPSGLMDAARRSLLGAGGRVDVSKQAEIGGREYEWKAVHTPSAAGWVRPGRVPGSPEGAAAYAYAEIGVHGMQPVRVEINSSDGIVVWLNGDPIMVAGRGQALSGERGHVVLDLTAGINRVLVLTLSSPRAWEFSVRVVDVDGQAVPFSQE